MIAKNYSKYYLIKVKLGKPRDNMDKVITVEEIELWQQPARVLKCEGILGKKKKKKREHRLMFFSY